jgi:hypothetical protein
MTGEQRARLARVRQRSLELIAPLEPEDLGLQGMADASPPKWHLGHTTWFFEQFLLRPLQESGLELGYEAAPAAWSFLFNSYNDAAGVSAAFARNLLVRLNRDLAGDFDPATFRYQARWEADGSRIAMALVSEREQTVTLAGERWTFAAGEELISEYTA